MNGMDEELMGGVTCKEKSQHKIVAIQKRKEEALDGWIDRCVVRRYAVEDNKTAPRLNQCCNVSHS